jgi:hypothetical protein
MPPATGSWPGKAFPLATIDLSYICDRCKFPAAPRILVMPLCSLTNIRGRKICKDCLRAMTGLDLDPNDRWQNLTRGLRDH